MTGGRVYTAWVVVSGETISEEPFLLAKPCKNCSHSFTVARPEKGGISKSITLRSLQSDHPGPPSAEGARGSVLYHPDLRVRYIPVVPQTYARIISRDYVSPVFHGWT